MKIKKQENIPKKIILKNNLEIRLIDSSKSELKTELETELLKQAFQMTYQVYIEEKQYLKKSEIPQKLNEKKEFFDKFDFTLNTRHILAIKENKVVGRARFTDGFGPISQDFNFKPYQTKINEVRYISRILTNPKERQSMSILLGLCNYTYQSSRHLGEFFCSSFSHGVNFYKSLGAIELETFKNSQFPNGISYAFKWNVKKLEKSFETNKNVKTRFIKEMIKPINSI